MVLVARRGCAWGAGGFWAPYATFISISIGYAIVAGSLVAFVEPLAAGSGIPEIKTYLNGIHIKGLLTVSPMPQFPSQPHVDTHFILHLPLAYFIQPIWSYTMCSMLYVQCDGLSSVIPLCLLSILHIRRLLRRPDRCMYANF